MPPYRTANCGSYPLVRRDPQALAGSVPRCRDRSVVRERSRCCPRSDGCCPQPAPSAGPDRLSAHTAALVCPPGQTRRTYAQRSPGRPQAAGTVRTLVLDMARDNPGSGSRRIHSELVGLGHKLAPPTVPEILKGAGTDPALRRSGQS